jgi:lysophospholipase L1-like esterase
MKRAWSILLICVLFLLIYPFAHQRIPFLQQHFTYFNIMDGVMGKQEAKKLASMSLNNEVTTTEQIIDSLTGDTLPPPPPIDQTPQVDTSELYTLLYRFYQALERASKNEGQARISYFGDSMIEGDLITQTLRNALQKQFGGTGVGFVPVTSQTATFRRSINHQFSDNISYYSLLKGKHPTFSFGYGGEVFPLKADSILRWVRYQSSKMYPTTDTFPQVRFFYQPLLGDAKYTESGKIWIKNQSISLPNKDTIESVWLTQKPSRSIATEFHLNRPIGAYGFSFESKNGVILDNLSMRGTNGITLLQIPGSTLRGFNAQLNPSLIVLQYGINMVESDRTNYEGYRVQLEKVIKHFQRNCPQASILVLGVADKGEKVDGELTTATCIPYILDAQRRAAANCGVAFFSLFDAMGGTGSMVKWVKEEKPALANLDYTHVNYLGAARLATYLKTFLIEGYQSYQQAKK